MVTWGNQRRINCGNVYVTAGCALGHGFASIEGCKHYDDGVERRDNALLSVDIFNELYFALPPVQGVTTMVCPPCFILNSKASRSRVEKDRKKNIPFSSRLRGKMTKVPLRYENKRSSE